MLKVLELFAGIGAFSEALTELGIEHEIVDAVENDKFAIASFNAIHGTNFEPQDITGYYPDYYCTKCHRLFSGAWLNGGGTTGGEMKCQYCHGGMEDGVCLEMAKDDVDIIMHGSPCQDFSVAGKQAGGDEGSGTRSSLMYETLRIVDELRPPIVIWENVKNLLSKKHRHNFDAYLKKMEKMGYHNYYKVLNAKDFGVPQNRERVFTVSLKGEFEFPEPKALATKLRDILEDEVDESYYLTEQQIKNFRQSSFNQTRKRLQEKEYADTLCARDFKGPKLVEVGNLYQSGGQAGRVYSDEGVSPAMDTCSGGNRMPKILQSPRGNNKGYELETCPTISSSEWEHNNVLKGTNSRIRKLTPKECWRLMGFSDEAFERASKVNSKTQLYKQAGNSIVVPVLKEIIKRLEVK